MASTVFSFGTADEDSGSDHEHWPDDFKPAPAPTVAPPAFDPRAGVRMHCHCHAAPSTKADSPPPPPSPKESVKAAVLTELPVQYTYAAPANMTTHAYVPAAAATVTVAATPAPPPAPKPAAPAPHAQAPNTYTYHPAVAEKPTEATNKWQGRTRAEVEEDNLKIAAEEKAWEKRKVVPIEMANDQMCWVVEVDNTYTLR
jgi:hypothetical protein